MRNRLHSAVTGIPGLPELSELPGLLGLLGQSVPDVVHDTCFTRSIRLIHHNAHDVPNKAHKRVSGVLSSDQSHPSMRIPRTSGASSRARPSERVPRSASLGAHPAECIPRNVHPSLKGRPVAVMATTGRPRCGAERTGPGMKGTFITGFRYGWSFHTPFARSGQDHRAPRWRYGRGCRYWWRQWCQWCHTSGGSGVSLTRRGER